jgi:signal transduction histidine kinase
MSNSGFSRTYFLRKTLRLILAFFKADEINLLLKVYSEPSRYEIIKHNGDHFRYNFIPPTNSNGIPGHGSALAEHWNLILSGNIDTDIPFVTKGGGLWISLPDEQILKHDLVRKTSLDKYLMAGAFNSLLITPFMLNKEKTGIFELASKDDKFLPDLGADLIESFVNTLGITLLNQHTQAALQERVKELSCLYGMSRIAETPYVPLEDLIYSTMDLIPPAWQYPEITRARIILDGIDYSLPEFESNDYRLASDIMIDGKKRGEIEIIYTRERPDLDEGPFLKEERKLIDTIAKELALIIERRESEEAMNKLQNQLHHTDRLATVGELAAGLAHEINEPMGSILGFAQLASKYPGVPAQVKKDLEKIVKSSLHAREIIKKMMLFSRQVMAQKKQVSINQVIEDSLYFYKSRCQKEGIKLDLKLKPNLPCIMADPVHINQVVLNIVVNAMQAMPDGGRLTIKTNAAADKISLCIKDTGMGMKEEVREQIFHPFFSTKMAGQGLGLGLSVVQGIINEHGGSISVISEPGKGSEFTIIFPINLETASNKGE